MAIASSQNIIVVGGSYVGISVAQQLAAQFHERFQVLLVEKNSHFQHLFAFPRFAVTSEVNTKKAFIPYEPGAFASCPPGSVKVIQAQIIGVEASAIRLDRDILLNGLISQTIPYTFLILATGTKSVPPSTLPGTQKQDGVLFLQSHAHLLSSRSKIVIIGGGAVGIQMATDIKEIYPEKSVTIVHSKVYLMNRFHINLHNIVRKRCLELGIVLKLGSRVIIPTDGYPMDGSAFDVQLQDGSKIFADLVIFCTGQVPQSNVLRSISPGSIDGRGFIRILKTMQIEDANYPNIFAIGDVADTGAAKAAKPGVKQAAVVVKNIQHILDKEALEEYKITEPPGIHLTLGIEKSVAFGNPVEGSTEPFTKHKNDGRLDMNIDAVWTRKGGGKDVNL